MRNILVHINVFVYVYAGRRLKDTNFFIELNTSLRINKLFFKFAV